MSRDGVLTRAEWRALEESERAALLARPAELRASEVEEVVRSIRDDVTERGDRALTELTARLDGVELESFEVEPSALANARASLDADSLGALERAIGNVERFHEAQRAPEPAVVTEPGVECRLETRPLDAVGLYVPGGTAPLVSTLVMLAVPARLAGCRERIVCTPPGPDGRVPDAVLAAASMGSVTRLFRVGGAQAVVALARGTESIPRVDKIFGPGNAYVAAAKELVSSEPGGPAVDLPAGPSEVLVVADDSADAGVVAADLLSQAEHDPMSQVVLVTPSARLAADVDAEVDEQLKTLPRSRIARESLANARAVLVSDLDEAVEVSNRYAPEHLILNCTGAESLVAAVRHAGSVFIGPWTAEAFGDYASGTNHVLPTAGAARGYSGLTLSSFQKTITVQRVASNGLTELGPSVERLARLEGLEGHARAIERRRRKLAASEAVDG